MKLQIDTEKKTIKLENDILLEKLISGLNKMFPNKEWKKFTLETNTTITHFPSQTIIKQYPVYPSRPFWEYPWITYDSTSAKDYSLKSGIYDVEIK